jgi:ABC-type thiamin/hydroxymethylpyrimidine transport system permease subunit
VPDVIFAPIAALLICTMGCAHRAQVAAILPSASIALAFISDSAVAGAFTPGVANELQLSVYATFRLRTLALGFPSAADADPSLAALPCDEDDATCQAEARGLYTEVLGPWTDQP